MAYLATGEAGIAHRTADNEVATGIDVEHGLLNTNLYFMYELAGTLITSCCEGGGGVFSINKLFLKM